MSPQHVFQEGVTYRISRWAEIEIPPDYSFRCTRRGDSFASFDIVERATGDVVGHAKAKMKIAWCASSEYVRMMHAFTLYAEDAEVGDNLICPGCGCAPVGPSSVQEAVRWERTPT